MLGLVNVDSRQTTESALENQCVSVCIWSIPICERPFKTVILSAGNQSDGEVVF